VELIERAALVTERVLSAEMEAVQVPPFRTSPVINRVPEQERILSHPVASREGTTRVVPRVPQDLVHVVADIGMFTLLLPYATETGTQLARTLGRSPSHE